MEFILGILFAIIGGYLIYKFFDVGYYIFFTILSLNYLNKIQADPITYILFVVGFISLFILVATSHHFAYYFLIFVAVCDTFALVASLYYGVYVYIIFYILNLFTLYTIYKDYTYQWLKIAFAYHFGISFDEAKSEVRFENGMAWAFRLFTGQLFDVTGLLFKPLTDAITPIIFGSMPIRDGIASIKEYRKSYKKIRMLATGLYVLGLLILIAKHAVDLAPSASQATAFLIMYDVITGWFS